MICKTCCGCQMLESHHQNDEIGNPFKLSGTIYKEQFQKVCDKSWSICEHVTLMLFIEHSLC